VQKSELLNWLQQQQQQWQALLAEIGPARMDQPGVNGDWSMNDIIAHLTGWNHWLVMRFQAAQRRQPQPPPPWPADLESDDEINAWIYDAYRGRSTPELLDEAEQSYRQLLALIAALPDDVRIEHVEPVYNLVWLDDQRYVVGEFFHHFHDDHEPDVRAWLAHNTEQA